MESFGADVKRLIIAERYQTPISFDAAAPREGPGLILKMR